MIFVRTELFHATLERVPLNGPQKDDDHEDPRAAAFATFKVVVPFNSWQLASFGRTPAVLWSGAGEQAEPPHFFLTRPGPPVILKTNLFTILFSSPTMKSIALE